VGDAPRRLMCIVGDLTLKERRPMTLRAFVEYAPPRGTTLPTVAIDWWRVAALSSERDLGTMKRGGACMAHFVGGGCIMLHVPYKRALADWKACRG
jgi:hypothetical protein